MRIVEELVDNQPHQIYSHHYNQDKFFPEEILSFHISNFYPTIGRAIKNEISHTITIIIATRLGLLCRAYFSGLVTAI
jgi:lantibiotic modifying enzyme